MKRIIIYILAVLMFAAITAGCKRIPLYEHSTNVKLELQLDLDIKTELNLSVETELDKDYAAKVNGKMPEYVEVLFYDVDSHKLVMSQILESKGGIITVPTGDYDMVIYNFGTESTQVDMLDDRMKARAYTTDITKHMASKMYWLKPQTDTTKSDIKGYENDPVIYEPDHLYVAIEENIHIPSFLDKQESVTIYATASTIIDVYSLEVIGVKGTENIEKVEAFITGQIKSNYFGKREKSLEPATVYSDMRVDVQNKRLYSIFGTFGKLPGEQNKIYLDITVTDSGGGQYRYIFDVTDQFDDPANLNNRLVIDASEIIDIPDAAHGGGGFQPTIDPWEKEEIDIPLG